MTRLRDWLTSEAVPLFFVVLVVSLFASVALVALAWGFATAVDLLRGIGG